MGLRYKKANVTQYVQLLPKMIGLLLTFTFFSPEMAVTVQLPILSVKKNPQNPLYTQLGVLTKGTVIEVNVSELGIVTAGGKVAWGKYAQVTNTPENDGCVNAYVFLPRCRIILAKPHNSVLLV
jgi:ribosome biogenesis protein NSA2